jgi:hypothetical protein
MKRQKPDRTMHKLLKAKRQLFFVALRHDKGRTKIRQRTRQQICEVLFSWLRAMCAELLALGWAR